MREPTTQHVATIWLHIHVATIPLEKEQGILVVHNHFSSEPLGEIWKKNRHLRIVLHTDNAETFT